MCFYPAFAGLFQQYLCNCKVTNHSTGSYPPLQEGRHLKMRRMESVVPLKAPYLLIASIEY